MSTPIFDSIRAEREGFDAGHVTNRHHHYGYDHRPLTVEESAAVEAEWVSRAYRRRVRRGAVAGAVAFFAGLLMTLLAPVPWDGMNIVGLILMVAGGAGWLVAKHRLDQVEKQDARGDTAAVLGLEDAS